MPTKSTPFAEITVEGFKSIKSPQSVPIRRLTIIAGANSAGKSTIMQPLLLLKQSLESPYDPGALLLSGVNAKFSSGDQLLTRNTSGPISDSFSVGLKIGSESVSCTYRWEEKKGFELVSMRHSDGTEINEFSLHSPPELLEKKLTQTPIYQVLRGLGENSPLRNLKVRLKRDRSFFKIVGVINDSDVIDIPIGHGIEKVLKNIIHLPGLRGNPERTYPVSAVGTSYPGVFQDYTASLIVSWENDPSAEAKIEGLKNDMKSLGLSWKVRAIKRNDTQVEIEVGRLPRPKQGGANDLVNIADVGLGVSQTLPLLVALQTATEDNVIYIEQPEIHLHPRAQVILAEIIARAARRGPTIILETHSAVMIRQIQTLIATWEIEHDNVSLNWFSRDDEGYTIVTHAAPDEAGAYGDWPEDFDEVSLSVEADYLTAVEKHRRSRTRSR